jgi:hypothetical protein
VPGRLTVLLVVRILLHVFGNLCLREVLLLSDLGIHWTVWLKTGVCHAVNVPDLGDRCFRPPIAADWVKRWWRSRRAIRASSPTRLPGPPLP